MLKSGVTFSCIVFLIACQVLPASAYDGEITYNATEATFSNSDDSYSGPKDIGFTFDFYDNSYTQAYINTNGTLNFGTGYSAFSNSALSSSNANYSIFPFWDDLILTGTAGVYHQTIGTSPNRKFVTQWTNMYFYGTTIMMGTFQVILYEGSNDIQIQYRDLLGGDRALGNSATVGIKRDTTIYEQHSYNTSSAISAEQAIRYSPNGTSDYTVNASAAYDPIYLAPEGTPPSPQLVNPTDGTTGITVSPTFEWLPASAATSYTLLVSTNSDFSSTVVNQGGITETSYTLGSSLGYSTQYYWRVQSVNSYGSSLSSIRSFTTSAVSNTAPDAPTSVSSASLLGGTSVATLNGATMTMTLSDSDTGEQVRYRIQIATDSGFSSLVIDYRSPFGAEGGVTYTYGESGGTYLVGSSSTELVYDDYYVRVRAEDDSAASSSWYAPGGISFSRISGPSITQVDEAKEVVGGTTPKANSDTIISIDASYAGGVSRVELYLDGEDSAHYVGGCSYSPATSPVTCNVDVGILSQGYHTRYVKVIGLDASEATSSADMRVSGETLNGSALLSTNEMGATDVDFTLSFTLAATQPTGTLTVTFPAGFTVTRPATAAGSSSCLSNFDWGPSTLTATKTNCVGTVILAGAQVTNPSSAGSFEITWGNDDGWASVIIVEGGAMNINATVDPTVSFLAIAQPAASTCASTVDLAGSDYAVELGTLNLSTLTESESVNGDGDTVERICTQGSTNAASGMVVTVKNANGSNGLVSAAVPTDRIVSDTTGQISAGDPAYGMCLVSSSLDADSGLTPAAAVPTGSGDFATYNCAGAAGNVVAFTGSNQQVWNAAGPTQDATVSLWLRTAISATQASHNDYADSLTFIATATY